MSRHTFHLPNELTDRIIDHLYNDRTSLKACSEVCQVWRCASQFQLFRHLSFTLRNPENDMYTMKSFWKPPPEGVAHYLRHVQTLTLTNGHSHFSRLDLNCLLEISNVLPNVRNLELCRTQWGNTEDDTTNEPPIVMWTSIRTLKISCVPMIVCPPHSLFALLHMLPNVEHLHLDTLPCYKLSILTNTRIVPPPVPKLRILTCHDLNHIGNLFLGLKSMLGGQLETVNVSGIYLLHGLVHLNNLDDIRFTLTTLRLEINGTSLIKMDHAENGDKDEDSTPEHAENPLQSLYLNRFTVLQNIVLIVRPHRYPVQIPILKQLPISIRTMAFELFWAPDDDSDVENCLDGLEESELLGHIKPLSHLEVLRFMPAVKGVELKLAGRRLIRERLPSLFGRGLLQIRPFHVPL